MPIVTFPDGGQYDVSTLQGRREARAANPGLIVDDTGYLVPGTGGHHLQGNHPGVSGGTGTPRPHGQERRPVFPPSKQALENVRGLARSGAIPAGPGGSYIVPIAQALTWQGPNQQMTLDKAVNTLLSRKQGGCSCGCNSCGGHGNQPTRMHPSVRSRDHSQGAPSVAHQQMVTYGLGLGLLAVLLLGAHARGNQEENA